jgi:hypothetical protein
VMHREGEYALLVTIFSRQSHIVSYQPYTQHCCSSGTAYLDMGSPYPRPARGEAVSKSLRVSESFPPVPEGDRMGRGRVMEREGDGEGG